MKTYLRIFWLISLLFFTAGCSGFQSACYTRSDEPGEIDDLNWDSCALRPGHKVRITTVTGNKVVGTITRISPEWITLAPENGMDPPVLYTPSQVVSIQKDMSHSNSPKTVENPEVGDEVALYLKDGSRIEGEVQVANSEEIVLAHTGESVQPRGYPISQIQTIETSSSGGSSSALVPVLVILGVGLIIGGVVLAESMSDLSEPIQIFGGSSY
jgi:hypothetical protein